MGWTGTPVVKSLGRLHKRVSGMTLAGGNTSATIGVAGSGADVILPSDFPTAPYGTDAAQGFTMADLVEVTYTCGNGAGVDANHISVDIQESPFMITCANDTANPSGVLSIRINYTHSLHR